MAYKNYVSFENLWTRIVVSKQFELFTPTGYLIRFAGTADKITVIGEDGSHAELIPEDKVGVLQGKVWTVNGPGRYPSKPERRMVARYGLSQKVLVISDEPVIYDSWEEKVSIFRADKIEALHHDLFDNENPRQYRVEGGDIIIVYTVERGLVHKLKIKQIVIRNHMAVMDDEAVIWLERHLGDKKIEQARILGERYERDRPAREERARIEKEKQEEEARVETARLQEVEETRKREKRETENLKKTEETTWRLIRRRQGDQFEFEGKTYVVHDHTVYLFVVGGKKISLDKAKSIGLFQAWHESLAHYAKG